MVKKIENKIVIKASEYIKSKFSSNIDCIIEAGSGFDFLASLLKPLIEIDYKDIPGFFPCNVDTHKGSLLIGEAFGKTFSLMRGRIHYYEGYSTGDVAFPIRVLKALGAKDAILTSSVGAAKESVSVGSVLCVCDYINFVQDSPFRYYEPSEGMEKYPDLTKTFDECFYDALLKADYDINLSKGTLAYFSGPQFETGAELDFLENLNVSAVGWSLIPEAMVAKSLSMRVLAFSLITDYSHPKRIKSVDLEDIFSKGSELKDRLLPFFSDVLRAL